MQSLLAQDSFRPSGRDRGVEHQRPGIGARARLRAIRFPIKQRLKCDIFCMRIGIPRDAGKESRADAHGSKTGVFVGVMYKDYGGRIVHAAEEPEG
jgi:hypothetical protein